MIIESDGSGGWFVQKGGTSWHITEAWLDEMESHHRKRVNPAWRRLRHLLRSGSTDETRVGEAFSEGYAALTDRGSAKPSRSSELREWNRGKRANRQP